VLRELLEQPGLVQGQQVQGQQVQGQQVQLEQVEQVLRWRLKQEPKSKLEEPRPDQSVLELR